MRGSDDDYMARTFSIRRFSSSLKCHSGSRSDGDSGLLHQIAIRSWKAQRCKRHIAKRRIGYDDDVCYCRQENLRRSEEEIAAVWPDCGRRAHTIDRCVALPADMDTIVLPNEDGESVIQYGILKKK